MDIGYKIKQLAGGNWKIPLSNSDKVRIALDLVNCSRDLDRVTAERDALRAELQKAREQGPIAWMNNQGETTVNEIQVEYWRIGGYQITPLYSAPVTAMPIPKQEPAGVATKNNRPLLYDDYSAKVIDMLECYGQMVRDSNTSGVWHSPDEIESVVYDLLHAPKLAQSPRITEQDAREIANNALEHVAGYQGYELDYWMDNNCCALLKKLNANPVAEVKQKTLITEEIKNVLRLAVHVVDYRAGDVNTEDGSYATTDTSAIINLESALCKALGTKYDDIDLAEALKLIDRLTTAQAAAIPEQWREIVEAVAHVGIDLGYGAYELEQDKIDKARELISSAPKPNQD